jgi:uncharacterized protein (DUF2141 family)
MKIIHILLAFFIVQLTTSFSPLQVGKISIEITGFKNNDGEVDIKLFNNEAGFPSDDLKAFRHHRVKIINNKCLTVFENIEYGMYAFIVFQDENNDKIFNKLWYGKPIESTVVSNYAKGFMKAPSYDDSKFLLNVPVKNIELKIHNF